uniref:Ubiquinol-cytochrome-c reductase complex assembly factor 1 n=1 Tax=Castor canadensis TaxID=51338 RepID=A0A8C0W717_CASCN
LALVRNQSNISQWVPVCSRLVPLTKRTLHRTAEWPQMSQSETCGGAEQILGVNILQSRKYHNSNKLHSTKESPQPIEEKVGAFTKIIEAMGFTGPLKYSKWVKSCSSDFSFGGF